jgi:hypothetical protein
VCPALAWDHRQLFDTEQAYADAHGRGLKVVFAQK